MLSDTGATLRMKGTPTELVDLQFWQKVPGRYSFSSFYRNESLDEDQGRVYFGTCQVPDSGYLDVIVTCNETNCVSRCS